MSTFHQVTLTVSDTLVSLCKYVADAHAQGVTVRHIHTDNGVFWSQEFRDAIKDINITISFSGVGAHHENGFTERAIKTIFYRACATMICAVLHWPKATPENLWPFAVDYVAHIWNNMELPEWGMDPDEILCGTKTGCKHVSTACVWGCPVFILEPALQDGHKIPKWQPCSRQG